MPRKKAAPIKAAAEGAVTADEIALDTQAILTVECEPRNVYEVIYNIQRTFRDQSPPQDSTKGFMEVLLPLLDQQRAVLFNTSRTKDFFCATLAHIPSGTTVNLDGDREVQTFLDLFGIESESTVLPQAPEVLPSPAKEPEVIPEAEAPPEPMPEPEVIIKPINPELGRGKAIDLQSLGVDVLLKMINVAETTQQLALVVDGAVDGEAWIDIKDREEFISAVRSKYATLARLANSGGRIPVFEKKMKEHVTKLEEEKHEEQEMEKWNAEIEEETKKNSESK